jgi:hypothetical protein
MASLADIYKQEKRAGKGLGSALGKKTLEKIDPRRMFDQSGLLTAMFPALRAYSATTKRKYDRKEDGINSQSLSRLEATTGLTAKNTIVLPAMARDMNLMRMNIQKLVKLSGGKASIKTDMFFQKSAEREYLFESGLKKISGSAVGKVSTSPKRDGQSKDTALYVKGIDGKDGNDSGSILGFLSKPGNLKTLGLTVARMIPYVAAAGGTVLGALQIMSDYREGSQRNRERGETSGGAAGRRKKEAIQSVSEGKNLSKSDADGIIDTLIKEKRFDEGAANPLINEMFPGIDLNFVLSKCSSDKKKLFEQLQEEARKKIKSIRPPESTQESQEPMGPPAPEPTPAPALVPAPSEVTHEVPAGTIVAPAAPTPAPQEPMGPPTPTPSVETTPHEVPAGTIVAPAAPMYKPESSRGGYRRRAAPTPVDADDKSVSTQEFNYDSYAQKIGMRESTNNYKAVNDFGYVGKYQMGSMALQDAGLVKRGTKQSKKSMEDANNWNLKGGLNEFLNNPELQEKTMYDYTKRNMSTLKRIGVLNKESSAEDIAGALGVSHLLGPGGAKELIINKKENKDAYGTGGSEYLKLGQSSQQTKTSLASSSPSSGTQLASASTAVSDAKMAAMTPPPATPTTNASGRPKQNAPQTSSSSYKTADAYNYDIFQSMVGTQYAGA